MDSAVFPTAANLTKSQQSAQNCSKVTPQCLSKSVLVSVVMGE